LLVLLGDSHTRSYKISDSVTTRIFLAQGRKNNFANYFNFVVTTYRYLRAASKLKKSGLVLAFIIGEPDVRRLAYGVWDIGRDEEDIFKSNQHFMVDDDALNKLVKRVGFFISITRFFKYSPSVIIGSGTPNPEIILASSLLNEKLNKLCRESGCLFFDPQKSSISNKGKLHKKFIGYSVFNPNQKDHTHLSTKIAECFDQFMAESFYEKISIKADWKKRSGFEKYFVEVNNFDTYRLIEFWPIRTAKLIRHYIKGRINF